MAEKTFELFASKKSKLNIEILRYIQVHGLENEMIIYDYDSESKIREFREYMALHEIRIIPTLLIRKKIGGDLLMKIEADKILEFLNGYFKCQNFGSSSRTSDLPETREVETPPSINPLNELYESGASLREKDDIIKIGDILYGGGRPEKIDLNLYAKVEELDLDKEKKDAMRAQVENSYLTRTRSAGYFYKRPDNGIFEMIKLLPRDPEKPGHPIPLDPMSKEI